MDIHDHDVFFPYIEYGVVTFNMRGVDGTIKFFPLENGSMRIVVS